MAAGTTSTKPAAKPRSPVERIIVWGVIGVLLVLVAVEFTFRSSHLGAYEACQKKIKATEEGDNSFKHKDVVAILGSKTPTKVEELQGKNIANGAKRVEIYTWPTLNPTSPRELYVYYGHGDDPDVIGVGIVSELTVDEAFPPLTKEQIEAASKNNTPLSTPGMGGPGGPGMMGGPGGPGAGGPGGARGGPPTGGEKAADGEKAETPAGDDSADEKKADEAADEEKAANE